MHNKITYTSKQAIWKIRIQRAYEKWFKEKYPAAYHDHGAPLQKYSDASTNDLTKAVICWLKYNNAYCNRIQSQGQIRMQTIELVGGRKIKHPSWTYGQTNRGSSDLISLIEGQFYSFEIKNKNTRDKLRPDQLRERKRIEASGGIYVVVESMEQFLEWWDMEFKTKNIL